MYSPTYFEPLQNFKCEIWYRWNIYVLSWWAAKQYFLSWPSIFRWGNRIVPHLYTWLCVSVFLCVCYQKPGWIIYSPNLDQGQTGDRVYSISVQRLLSLQNNSLTHICFSKPQAKFKRRRPNPKLMKTKKALAWKEKKKNHTWNLIEFPI